MSFKNEFKQIMNNVIKDAEKAAKKEFVVQYDEHEIIVNNEMMCEQLIIDGVLAAEKKRKSIWTHVIPYVTLKGKLSLRTGEEKQVLVKVGGIINFNCKIKVGSETIFNFKEKFEVLPWKNKTPIVVAIREQIEENGQVIKDELPDDEYVYDENHPRLEAGQANHLSGDFTSPLIINKLFKLIDEALKSGDEKDYGKLYEEIMLDETASYYKKLIEGYPDKHYDETKIVTLIDWLLKNGAHREVVKFALVLISCIKVDKYKDLLFEIGQHEEFTKFAALALEGSREDNNEIVFELAKKVSGWGRIATVPLIQGSTEEIRQWLIFDANKNTALEGYNAFECIAEGRLDQFLAADKITVETYNKAGQLLTHVLSHQAAGGSLKNYEHHVEVLENLIKHSEEHCQQIEQLYPLTLIEQYLLANANLNDESLKADYEQLLEKVQAITSNRRWLSLAVDTLIEELNLAAFKVTQFYGVNSLNSVFAQLRNHADDHEVFKIIMENGGKNDIKDLCDFTLENYDFVNLTKREINCLQTILMTIYLHDLVHLPFLTTILKTNNEDLYAEALSALTYLPKEEWYVAEVINLLDKIRTDSGDKDNRRLAKELLKG